MPQKTPSLPLVLPPRDAGTPAYRWLGAALRAGILAGRLGPGARLPSTRELAGQYQLSRGTVVLAYEQLKSEGYARGTVGSGTYVNPVVPDELLQVPRRDGARPAAPRVPRRHVSAFAKRVRPFALDPFPPTRAFRTNQPALDLFPTMLWAQLTGRRLRRATPRHLLGCHPLGYPALRDAVAEYLRTSRGVQCAAEQVVILSGVQEALDLVARLLLDPGDRVCIEDPGYVGAALAFEACGAKITCVAVDDEGMSIPGPGLRDVRLAYVTPAHQFPLGVSMSLPRRLALLEWARHSGALVLEDDYDGEYRFSGRPLPALQGLDRHALVLFAGTFGKVLFPSLRLGYLVIPADLVDAFAAAKSVATRHAPLLDQAVLSDFITDGHFGRHIRRMREVYAERRGVLLEAARHHLAGLLEISGVEAGLQTAGWLAEGIVEERAAAAAARRNVDVTPLGRYSRGRAAREGLHLGFAAVDAQEIRRGVRELATALEGELRRR